MASTSLSCYAEFGSTNRTVTATISSDYNSGYYTVDLASTYSTSSGPYTRVGVYINGSLVYDSGYSGDFSSFPTKRNSTYSFTINNGPTRGVISVGLGIGVGHNILTDATDSKNLIKVAAPSFNNITSSDIKVKSGTVSTSISDDGGAAITSSQLQLSRNSNFSPIEKTINGLSGTFSDLTPETKYYVRGWASNNYQSGTSSSTEFTTLKNPKINNVSINATRTSCTLTPDVEYATGDSFKSNKIEYAISGSPYGAPITSNTNQIILNNLSPNTTYNYKITVYSNKDGETSWTNAFKTSYDLPVITPVGPGENDSKIEAITGGFNCIIRASADTAAPITEYYLEYKPYNSQNPFSSTNASETNTISINTLALESVYECRLKVKNSEGDIVYSDSVIVATLTQMPRINSIIDLIDGITLGVTVNAEPSGITQNLKYSFSIDDGENWTTPSDSNSYTWPGLEELTTYPIKIRVIPIHRNQEYGEDKPVNEVSHPLTTDVDQAKIRIKTGGNWIEGKTYIKQNNQWVKAKRIYIKKNNQWVIGKNQ